MQFFLSLYDISKSSFLVFFQRAIDFFNTPVNSLFSRYYFRKTPWFDVFLSWLGIRKYHSTTNPVIDFFFNLAGFDLSQPLWLFLLSHLTFIIGCLIIIKILDFIN